MPLYQQHVNRISHASPVPISERQRVEVWKCGRLASSTLLHLHSSKRPCSVPEVCKHGQVVPPDVVLAARQVLRQANVRYVLRPARLANQLHVRLVQVLVALADVALAAGAHQILPHALPAVTARHHVVDGEVLGAVAAVLAHIFVPREDRPTRKLQFRQRPADVVAKLDHGRELQGGIRAPDHEIICVQHVGLAQVDHRKGAANVAHVQRLEIAIEYENLLVHCLSVVPFVRMLIPM